MNSSLHPLTRLNSAINLMKTMKKTFAYPLLIALFLLPATHIAAEERDSTDFETVITATHDNDLKYEDLKKNLLQRYNPLVKRMQQAEQNYVSLFDSSFSADPKAGNNTIPADFSPWWIEKVHADINPAIPGISTDVTSLFTRALKHSSQIMVFKDLPLIRETTIQETQGTFDFKIFAEGRFSNLNEPVGDDLKTGGPLRYEENSKNLEYGISKKFAAGTEIEFKQNIGDLDTNSTFFNPQDQAKTGTWLTIRQPLLNQFGISYNEAPFNLAGIDHGVAQKELRRNIESHLLEISRAYWGLYLERSLLLQKSRLAQKTTNYLSQMQQRTGIDITPSLLARAKSLASSHKLAAMQAEYAMLNAQSRIRALVNDPEFTGNSALELTTKQLPVHKLFDIQFDNTLQTTLENRPEIAQAIKQIQAAKIRLERSKNETLPNLDLFFQTSVKGLKGDYEYGTAYSNQFDEGNPSYIGGLRFEYPLGNNSARARLLRKKLEIRQLLHRLDTTVENVLLEAQVSYRELTKNYRSMIQGYQIMTSDREEGNALTAQIDYLLAKNQPYGDVLYQLMDASERLTTSEELFAKSELTYNYSLYNLYRAMGILVSNQHIIFQKDTDKDELPIMQVRQE